MLSNANTLLSTWVWNSVCPPQGPVSFSKLSYNLQKGTEQALKHIKNNPTNNFLLFLESTKVCLILGHHVELSLYWGLKCQNKEGFVYIFTFDFIYWKCWSTKWEVVLQVFLIWRGNSINHPWQCVSFGIPRRHRPFLSCILAFDSILGPHLELQNLNIFVSYSWKVLYSVSLSLLLNIFLISLI